VQPAAGAPQVQGEGGGPPAEEDGGAVGEERRFRVFVAGASWRSQRVVDALHALCAAHGIADHTVEVVDVLRDPARAERDRVLALPMVMRIAPEPVVRVVGDLSDGQVAAEVLGLASEPARREPPAGEGGTP
jgi:circadian clock protein KaiB